MKNGRYKFPMKTAQPRRSGQKTVATIRRIFLRAMLPVLLAGLASAAPEPLYPTVFLNTGGDTFDYVKDSLGGTYLGPTRIYEDGTIEGLWGKSRMDPPWPVSKGIFLWDKQQGLRSVYTLPGQGQCSLEWVSRGWFMRSDGKAPSLRYFLWSRETGELALPVLDGKERFQEANVRGVVTLMHGFKGLVWSKEKGLSEIGVALKKQRQSVVGINEAGMVLGQTSTEAFVWSETTGVTRLGEGTVAGLLNDRGQVAGKIKLNGDDGWSVFLWTQKDGLEVLATFEDAKRIQLVALTETGLVLGTIQYTEERGGAVFRWSRQAGLEVVPAFGGREQVGIRDWTEAGTIVGNVFLRKERHKEDRYSDELPFVWLPGKAPELLPLLEGTKNSTAKKINDHGQVIGESHTAMLPGKSSRSWVWSREAGIRELDIKVPWKNSQVLRGDWGVHVTDINNAGQIVGVLSLYELDVDDESTAVERVWWHVHDWLAQQGICERKFRTSRKGSFMWKTSVLWEVPPEKKAAEPESRRKRD